MNCSRCGIMLGGDGDVRYGECDRLYVPARRTDSCRGWFHLDCLEEHETEVHLGVKERAVLAEWKRQAAERQTRERE